MSLHKGQDRNHWVIHYWSSHRELCIKAVKCQAVMFHFTGVGSFKSCPSLHVSLSICQRFSTLDKYEKLLDLIRPKRQSIRQFVEFEANRSESILIFPLSNESRLMSRCLPKLRALPRLWPCWKPDIFLASDWSRSSHPALSLVQSLQQAGSIWRSLSRVMENLNIQDSGPPATKYQAAPTICSICILILGQT